MHASHQFLMVISLLGLRERVENVMLHVGKCRNLMRTFGRELMYLMNIVFRKSRDQNDRNFAEYVKKKI